MACPVSQTRNNHQGPTPGILEFIPSTHSTRQAMQKQPPHNRSGTPGPQLLTGKVATCVYAQLCHGTFCDKGQLWTLSSLYPDKLGHVP